MPLLSAAVILLALSTLISTTLHFYNPWRSTPQAETATEAANPEPATQGKASVPQIPPAQPHTEGGPPKPDASGGVGTTHASGEPAHRVKVELNVEAVEKAAKEAKSQMDVAGAAANEAMDTLGQIPKEISTANLDDARQKLGIADGAAKKAREAAAESKKQHEEAKKAAAVVGQAANDLLARAKDDAKTKEAAQEAKKRAQEAAGDADQSSRDADKRAGDAENALRQAKVRLDAAEKQIKDDLARAPEVEAKLRPRENHWSDPNGRGQVNRQVVWPSPAEGNRRVFALQSGRRFAFLELPQDVRDKVTGFEAQQTVNGVTLNLTVEAGLDRQKDFIASRIDEKRRVSCQILEVPNMPLDLTAIRDWLVIEVADLDARRVHQCPLSGREKRVFKEVAVGYDREGKGIRLEPVCFVYPWPDMLTVHVGSKQAERMQTTDMKRDCPLELKDSNVKAALKIEITKKNDYELLCSVPALLTAIDSEVSKAKDAWADARSSLDATEKELAELGKNPPHNNDKKKDIEKRKAEKQKALQESERPLGNLLVAAKQALNQNGRVLICDAWEVPVVDLKIRFEGEAGAIIKAALEKK